MDTNYLSSKGISIHVVKGRVTHLNMRVESTVSGNINISGGGGAQVGGTTYQQSNVSGGGTIKTEHVRIQDIYLETDLNKEKHISTNNFVVPCREGHGVGILFFSKKHMSIPVYAFNTSTDEDIFDWDSAFDMLVPLNKWIPALGIPAAIIGFILGAAIFDFPFSMDFLTFIAAVAAGFVGLRLGWYTQGVAFDKMHKGVIADPHWKQAVNEITSYQVSQEQEHLEG